MNIEWKYTSRRAVRVFRLVLVASAFATLGCIAACGSEPAGPGNPAPARQLASFTEWVTTEPELVQGGDFHYDELDHLVRYEFGLRLPDGSLRRTMLETYDYEDGQLVTAALSTRLVDDTWWLTRHLTYRYDEQGRAVEVDAEESDERGGVRSITYHFEYTPLGQVALMRVGDGQEIEYSYDTNGNVVRVESRDLAHTVLTFEHDGTVNPFRSLPILANVTPLGVWDSYSRHNSVRMESGEVARDPVAFGSGSIEADADGYPLRKEWTVWNASDPTEKTEFVTIYVYE